MKNTFIFHFTHHNHLTDICNNGLRCKAMMQIGAYIDISSQSVQDNRARTKVPIDPPDGYLHDYVPFYFGTHSPTLYHIWKNPYDHQGVSQNQLIYLVTTAERIAASQLNFVFTDGHGVVAMTEYYSDLSDLDKIDVQVVNQKFWADTPDDPDKKRRKQAEFLVHKVCPWETIIGIAVFDNLMEAQIRQQMVGLTYQPKVAVRREWYYS